MILNMSKLDHRENGAMVYVVRKADIPKGVRMPNRAWAIKTVGSIKALKVKRSDRKIIVADIATPKKLRLELSKLRKLMRPNGFTSVAIVKQGKMKYRAFFNTVKEVLSDSIVDIEVYDSVP